MHPAGTTVDRDEQHRLAAVAMRLARAPSAACRRRARASTRRCRHRPARPSTRPLTPLPVVDTNPRRARNRDACAPRPRRRSRPPADARCRARRPPPAAAPRPRSSRAPARSAVTRGLPSVSVPVLSTTSVSTLREQFERFGVPDQHAGLRAPPGADHDRHRRRQAERARTRDDQHRDGADERVREARLRSPHAPRDERQRPRPATTAGTKYAATRSASR